MMNLNSKRSGRTPGGRAKLEHCGWSLLVCSGLIALAGCGDLTDTATRVASEPAPPAARQAQTPGSPPPPPVDRRADDLPEPAGESRTGQPAAGTAGEPSAQEPSPVPVEAQRQLHADERATIQLFATVSPSVVHITTHAIRRDFFTMNTLEIPSGTGTGIIWDDQGHVVTNFHVIQGAAGAQVAFADQSSYPADLVGVAPDKDLAVLRVKAPREVLRPVTVGTSHDLQVGQWAFAIGNPFGLDYSLTTGVVSALGRELNAGNGRVLRDVIQTDTAINPGNSGGPLLDSSGRLIGVTSAIYSPSGAYAGVGFAIPVDTVAWVVPELIKHGKIIRPTLGITVAADNIAKRLDVEGVLVLNVAPGSTAEEAGLQPALRDRSGRIRLGDRIVAFDRAEIRSTNDLLLAFDRRKAGEIVTLTVIRDGRRVDLEVELESSD